MKTILMLALISAPAFAENNVCEALLPCGTFSGPVFSSLDKNATPDILETVTVSDLGDGSESLVITRSDLDGKSPEAYGNFRLVPRAGQGFDIYTRSNLFAGTGNCGYGRCTYGSNPQKETDGSWAGLFTFSGDELVRSQVIQSVNGETEFSIARMRK